MLQGQWQSIGFSKFQERSNETCFYQVPIFVLSQAAKEKKAGETKETGEDQRKALTLFSEAFYRKIA